MTEEEKQYENILCEFFNKTHNRMPKPREFYLIGELAKKYSNPVEAEVKQAACGQEILKAMMELKYDPDKDMMPTVKRVEKANGGFTTYFRHDAVIKYCNEHFISKPSV